MTKSDPATVSIGSLKGKVRRSRIEARIDYLARAEGWEAKALRSALVWVLARLQRLEHRRTISQAQAVDIIKAWTQAGAIARREDGTTTAGAMLPDDARPVLEGLDLEGLGIE